MLAGNGFLLAVRGSNVSKCLQIKKNQHDPFIVIFYPLNSSHLVPFFPLMFSFNAVCSVRIQTYCIFYSKGHDMASIIRHPGTADP